MSAATQALRRLAPGALVLLAGCAQLSPKQDFADVSRLVADRGGLRIHWNQGGPEDAQVQERIATLLSGELTEEAAVEVALLNNPGLQATYEELGVAQADLVQAGLLKNPSLGAVVQFPLGAGGFIAPSFSLAQEFLDLFLIPLRTRVAQQQLEQAKLRVGDAVLALAAEVRGAYVDVLAAEQLLRIRGTIVEAERLAAELNHRQHQAQNISDLDFVNEVLVSEQLRLDLERDQVAAGAQRERLNRLLGVWGAKTAWTLPASLPPLPKTDPALEGLERRAVAQRLDLEVARGEVEALGQTLGLTRDQALLGSVELGAEGGRDVEGHTALGPSLSLQLPLFDQGQAATARLQARLRQARSRQAELAIRIRSEVRQTHARLVAARRVADAGRTTLIPLRERAVALSQQSYNAMLIGVFQLLQAKQAEGNAYREYLDAVREYWNAHAELERVVGGRLDSPSTPGTDR